jgi:hypothetical protein
MFKKSYDLSKEEKKLVLMFLVVKYLSQQPNVAIKGSFVYFTKFTDYKRIPNDIDFNIELDIGREEKLKKCREILTHINKSKIKSKLYSPCQYTRIDYDVNADFMLEYMVNSPIGRKQDRYEVSLEKIGLKHLEVCDKYRFLLCPFEISSYMNEMMFIDKLFSLFYFTADIYKGDTKRLYCAIYDVEFMIRHLNMEIYDIRNAIYIKINEDFNKKFGFNLFVDFFRENPDEYRFMNNQVLENYSLWIKDNNLDTPLTDSDFLSTISLYRKCALNDMRIFKIVGENEC